MKNIDPPTWIKHNKVTINTKNTKDNNCYIKLSKYWMIRKEFLNLNHLLLITIGTILVFQQGIKTILRSRKIIVILQ